MRTYHHRFTVRASLAEVGDFHQQSRSMGAITPPPIIARVHQAPAHLGEGDEMAFTLWMAFVPIHWRARIEGVSDRGFVDRQLVGPFAQWVHHHEFNPISDVETEVVDTVSSEFHPSLPKRLIGMGMWLGMPLLFAYRGWKTRRILEGSRTQVRKRR